MSNRNRFTGSLSLNELAILNTEIAALVHVGLGMAQITLQKDRKTSNRGGVDSREPSAPLADEFNSLQLPVSRSVRKHLSASIAQHSN